MRIQRKRVVMTFRPETEWDTSGDIYSVSIPRVVKTSEQKLQEWLDENTRSPIMSMAVSGENILIITEVEDYGN